MDSQRSAVSVWSAYLGDLPLSIVFSRKTSKGAIPHCSRSIFPASDTHSRRRVLALVSCTVRTGGFGSNRTFAAEAANVDNGPRLCENYRGGGKTTKMTEFMASLVELSHKIHRSPKMSGTKRRRIGSFHTTSAETGLQCGCSERRFVPQAVIHAERSEWRL